MSQLRPSTAVGGTALQRRSRPFGREFSCFSPKGPAGRSDKPPFQRRKPRFSAAMKIRDKREAETETGLTRLMVRTVGPGPERAAARASGGG